MYIRAAAALRSLYKLPCVPGAIPYTQSIVAKEDPQQPQLQSQPLSRSDANAYSLTSKLGGLATASVSKGKLGIPPPWPTSVRLPHNAVPESGSCPPSSCSPLPVQEETKEQENGRGGVGADMQGNLPSPQEEETRRSGIALSGAQTASAGDSKAKNEEAERKQQKLARKVR